MQRLSTRRHGSCPRYATPRAHVRGIQLSHPPQRRRPAVPVVLVYQLALCCAGLLCCAVLCLGPCQLVALLSDALEDYNVTNPTQMNLVFFRDAVEHVCRISRILRQVRCN